MVRIGVLVSGGGTNLQALIDSMESGGINGRIVTVISSAPGAYALCRAEKHGIESGVMRKKDYPAPGEYERALIRRLKSRGAELVVLAGFMVILGGEFIRAFENRIMNVHPSLIPSFCGSGFYGLKVHEAALEAGVKITGATVHFVTEETDAGPIILQKAVEVIDGDTPESLQRRVMEEAEWVIFPEAVKLFCEGALEIKGNKVRRRI